MIKIENLSYQYHGSKKFALNNINLNIKEGEKIAIIGDNGSGKSTLAKILIGLVKPQSGSIYVEDLLLNEKNLLAIREKIGVVFQNPNYQFIGSNVEEDLAFGLQNKNIDRNEMIKIIDDIANEFEISHLLKSEPHNLSGGQKQKVALASILVLNPEYLILDEVTSMLDSKNTKEIWKTIENIHHKNMTVISITHNMDLAALADRIIVMSNGKIIGDGSPKKIFDTKFANEDFVTPSFEVDLSSKLFGNNNTIGNFQTLVSRLEKSWKSK